MPWKLTLIDTLLPKPAKNFVHSKTNGAERQITVMIYNDTHFAPLERTSSLARGMVKEASFFSPQAASWYRSLGSPCDRESRSHDSIVPMFILKIKSKQNKIELFVFIAFYFPTQTHISLFSKTQQQKFLKNNRGDCWTFKIIYVREYDRFDKETGCRIGEKLTWHLIGCGSCKRRTGQKGFLVFLTRAIDYMV